MECPIQLVKLAKDGREHRVVMKGHTFDPNVLEVSPFVPGIEDALKADQVGKRIAFHGAVWTVVSDVMEVEGRTLTVEGPTAMISHDDVKLYPEACFDHLNPEWRTMIRE